MVLGKREDEDARGLPPRAPINEVYLQGYALPRSGFYSLRRGGVAQWASRCTNADKVWEREGVTSSHLILNPYSTDKC